MFKLQLKNAEVIERLELLCFPVFPLEVFFPLNYSQMELSGCLRNVL